MTGRLGRLCEHHKQPVLHKGLNLLGTIGNGPREQAVHFSKSVVCVKSREHDW